MSHIKEYWDKSLNDRITPRGIVCNGEKYIKIINFCKRLQLKGLKKLEIGAGVCHIASKLAMDNYTAVDLSGVGFEFAKTYYKGRFLVGDIATIDLKEQFDVIMAFDSLEHMPLNQALIDKIQSLSHKDTFIIGNVPLVNSQHNLTKDIEHDMSAELLIDFLIACKFYRIKTEVFWTKAVGNKDIKKVPKDMVVVYYPYMLFKGMRRVQ